MAVILEATSVAVCAIVTLNATAPDITSTPFTAIIFTDPDAPAKVTVPYAPIAIGVLSVMTELLLVESSVNLSTLFAPPEWQ